MLNAVLSKLKLPDKTAIKIENSNVMGQFGTFFYLFVSDGISGELLTIGNGQPLLVSDDLLKITIRTVQQDVYDENNTLYSNVYEQRYADISTTTDPDEAWTIVSLTEVIESALYRKYNVIGYSYSGNDVGNDVTELDWISPGLKIYDSKITIRLTLNLYDFYCYEGTNIFEIIFENIQDTILADGEFPFIAEIRTSDYVNHFVNAILHKSVDEGTKIKVFVPYIGEGGHHSISGIMVLNAVFAL